MEIKSKIGLMLCIITLIASISFVIPITLSNPDTYGPRLDTLYGHFIESPAAQRYALETGEVDFWPDIRDPEILRDFEEEGYEVVTTAEAFVFYHIDFNVRDQIGNGTHVECEPPEPGADPTWTELPRGPDGTSAADRASKYYQYYEAAYMGYVPLDDINFRHAVAHTRPLAEIVAVVYGGISGAAIDSLVPPAQKAWWNPDVDGHPLALGSPTATTEYNPATGENHDACSILRYGHYVWEPTAPNPAPKYSEADPDGNWLDPHLHAAVNDPDTVWDDTEMMPMNHITFSGVTVQIAPDSFGRDDLCHRNMRAIGLPIEHSQEDYGHLTDVMMDFYQYDMYALGWSIGRFPSTLYGLHHSSQNFVPEGGNMEGVDDPELDGYLEIIQFSTDIEAVTQACMDAQDRLAYLCMSLPTITRPFYVAGVKEGAPIGDPNPAPDTMLGIINIPGFGADTQWSMTGFHWESMISETNPLGIGGRLDYIVPSEPTNYHPGYASTTDEFLVLQNIYDNGAMEINPYTHEDIPWLATKWNVSDWTEPSSGNPGMNITFWLRDDVYWHDGEKFDAYDAKFSLEFMQEQTMANLFLTWQYLVDVEVHNSTMLSVYQNTTSLWILYFVAGGINVFPEHVYAGTGRDFRPEAKAHSFAVVGEYVGHGNGTETLFHLDNAPVIDEDGDLPETVYVNGTATNSTYWPNTIDRASGNVTFTTAPPNCTDITADYRYKGVSGLTCLIGTGPFVYIEGDLWLGGYCKMEAYRVGVAPVTTNWFMTVEEFDALVAEMFHWTGDVSGQALGSPPDGEIGVYDLGNGGKCYGTYKGEAGYNENVDINPEPTYHNNDDFIDIRDLAEISKNYGKKRDYPRG